MLTMIWKNHNDYHKWTILLLVLHCLFLTVHCGFFGRFENRRRTISNDPLTGRLLLGRSGVNRLLSSNSGPGSRSTSDNDEAQSNKRPSLITSSHLSETISLTSASLALQEPSSSSKSDDDLPPSEPSEPSTTSSPVSSPMSDADQSQTSSLPLPPQFPGVSEGVLSRDMLNIVSSNNLFGFKLLKALAKFNGKENLFISPLSLFSTLVTVYAGSSSSTEDEMISLLHLKTMTEGQIEKSFRDVMHSLLTDIGQKNTLKLLNAILIDDGFNVSSAYVHKVRTYYNAYLAKVGFATEPAYVTQWTNELVSWWTKGLIPTLLDSQLDQLTRLLLINVIYFKGVWSEPFNPSQTNDQTTFRNFDGSTSKVPMMRSISTVNYHCDYVKVKACAVEKLYSGGALSFLVIIPINGTDLSSLEASLGPELMYEMISQLQEATIELGLPRFSISGSYNLLKPLEYLGMKAAFSPKKANLSKMANSKDLFVKEAKHKTVLEVNEEGSVAAGATVVEIATRHRSPRITVDHPFLFLIRDLKTDSILFLGKINSLP